jgi:hypothetical protein
MATVFIISNPFDTQKSTKQYDASAFVGRSVWDWLRSEFPGFKEFSTPTICLRNGTPVMRKDWEQPIHPNEVITFCAAPGAALPWIWYAIIAVVLVTAVVLMMPSTNLPKDLPEAGSVYGLNGQRNRMRLGQPIESHYGRCRIFPSLSAMSYNSYIGNDQWVYQLFCVGQGYYDVESVQIEDTPVANFQDVVYELVPPGGSVTLFPDNVVTSPEVSNVEVLATNEPGYVEYGPFVVNPTGTTINWVEMDISFPYGLYKALDNGSLASQSASLIVSYQAINASGTPIGSWAELMSSNWTMATNTPQRMTIATAVTPGRYQIKFKRTDVRDTTLRTGNKMFAQAVRGFCPSTVNYGNVTMLAVKAKATNNLNNDSENRFNLWATRKLPIWNKVTQTFSAPTATRSISWALVDGFRAQYGGRLANMFLDLDGFYDLDATWAARGETFDYTADVRGTCWDFAKIVANAGRAVPMLNGSRITMIRDEPKTIPAGIFNKDNMVEGSFSREMKFVSNDEYDGLEVEYIDPTTFKPAYVKCLLDGEAGDNCEKAKIPGVTVRLQAWRLGYYMRACKKKLTQNISLSTGMEGLIPAYGDMVAIASDLPKWASGGQVMDISGTTLTLSDPVTFGAGSYCVVLRKKDGSCTSPITCVAGAASNQVIVPSAPTLSDYQISDLNERPYYLFGLSTNWGKLAKVVNIAPNDDCTVDITCTNYDPSVYPSDAATPPGETASPVTLVNADLPVVTGLKLAPSLGVPNMAVASWAAAPSATSYALQISYDGSSWIPMATTSELSAELTVIPRFIYARVCAINVGAGPWATWSGDLSVDQGATTTDVTGAKDQATVQVAEQAAISAQGMANFIASLGDASAAVQVLSDAFITTSGRAVSSWGFKLDANGKVVGMQATAASGGSQPELGEIVFTGANLRSDNYVDGPSGDGWKLGYDGVFKGSRMELRDPLITNTVSMPSVSPASKLFTTSETVSAAGESGATLRYTTDGSEVDPACNVFPGGGLTISETTVLRVRAFKTGTGGRLMRSPELQANYTKNSTTPRVATPSIWFSPGSGSGQTNSTCTIGCATSGASIYYAINGGSNQVYTGTFSISDQQQVSTYAAKSGMTDSDSNYDTYTKDGIII